MDFRSMADKLLIENNVEVVGETSGMYGHAKHHTRKIVVPKSLGYLGFAIFCHEVGHIVLGHCDAPNKKYRCQEEYEAWKYAQDTFKRLGIPFKRRVAARMKRSLRYAKSKALRRGMLQSNLPTELKKY